MPLKQKAESKKLKAVKTLDWFTTIYRGLSTIGDGLFTHHHLPLAKISINHATAFLISNA